MKALWLCNVVLPEAKSENSKQPLGGWLTGELQLLTERNDKLKITIVCPSKQRKCFSVNGHTYYTFEEKDKIKYKTELKYYFQEIIVKEKPDIIHIFGTEFPHSLSMVEAAQLAQKGHVVVVHIQGLMSIYEKHYYGTMRISWRYMMTIRDVLKLENVALARKHARKRGMYEIKMLQSIPWVAGRTMWDSACTELINPNAQYFHCREVLRDSFYNHKWSIDKCRKHTIFFSQPMSYVKAFYQLLRVFPEIKKIYPDAKIVTTGNLFPRTVKERMKESWYLKSMRRFIIKNDLKKSVIFKGVLSEEEMLREYLSAHIFVSTSTIENSPNSLGEAMLLGVPSISSDVGGVSEMMRHGVEGFVYPCDEDYMLLWYILKLFKDDNLCNSFSEKACLHAQENHSKEINYEEVMSMYNTISSQKE